MQTSIRTVILCLLLGTAGRAEVLYDGSLGTTPPAQGYLTYQSIPSATFFTTSGGKTTLSTTAVNTIYAGFHNYDPTLTNVLNPLTPALDRSVHYDISLDIAINLESHTSSNRAGFSLLAIGNDLQGIELGFWTTQIAAQNVGFTFGESVSLATTTRHTYDLVVQGSSYQLFSDGSSILTGALRDYSAAGAPYNKPNLFFVGDDTTSALGSTDIFKISIVPEPAGVAGVAMSLLLLKRRRPCRD